MQKSKNKSYLDKEKQELLVKFGKRMKELRNERSQIEGEKFSQEKLAALSGLHRNYISDTERGVRNVSVFSLQLIISGLGCSLSDFFSKGFEDKAIEL